jgi:hypothetical protein
MKLHFALAALLLASTAHAESNGNLFNGLFGSSGPVAADKIEQPFTNISATTNITAGGTVSASAYYGDGSHLTGISSGGADRKFVTLIPPTTQSFATGGSAANNLVSFTTVGVSSTAAFASQFNASNSTFTVSETGVYNFRARLTGFFSPGTTNSFMFYYIYSGSNAVAFCPGAEADTNNYNSVSCLATLALSAGDVITMKYGATGAANRLDSGGGYSQLYIEKIK